ncbi:MAG: hypothetical protein ACJ735_07490 [Actinomycetes bacterium]
MKRVALWALVPVLASTALAGLGHAAAAPVGAGSVTGKVYDEHYGNGYCWITFTFSGRMPTSTNVVNVVEGVGRSSYWNCDDAQIDTDIDVKMTGNTPSGSRTWDCPGHVTGGGTYAGFSGVSAICSTNPGGATFVWKASLLERDASIYDCGGHSSCESAPFHATYTAQGRPHVQELRRGHEDRRRGR